MSKEDWLIIPSDEELAKQKSEAIKDLPNDIDLEEWLAFSDIRYVACESVNSDTIAKCRHWKKTRNPLHAWTLI